MTTDEALPTASDVVGQRVRAARRRLDLSADQLAERCAAMGSELTRQAIFNIETGRPDAAGRRRRHVTVDELLVLATALNVSPMHLLVPDGDQGEPYAYAPSLATNRRTVREWVAGRRPIFGQDLNQFIAAVPSSDPDGFWDRFPELRAELQAGEGR